MPLPKPFPASTLARAHDQVVIPRGVMTAQRTMAFQICRDDIRGALQHYLSRVEARCSACLQQSHALSPTLQQAFRTLLETCSRFRGRHGLEPDDHFDPHAVFQLDTELSAAVAKDPDLRHGIANLLGQVEPIAHLGLIHAACAPADVRLALREIIHDTRITHTAFGILY